MGRPSKYGGGSRTVNWPERRARGGSKNLGKTRRENVSPMTGDRIYDDAEAEFLAAMQAFKAKHRVLFPTISDHLEVLLSLGYAKP